MSEIKREDLDNIEMFRQAMEEAVREYDRARLEVPQRYAGKDDA